MTRQGQAPHVHMHGRLKKLCSNDIVISRLGGDEFGVLMRLDPTATDQFMRRVYDTITTPVEVYGDLLSVGCSIGFARFPTDARSADELLQQADVSLYVNKRAVAELSRVSPDETKSELGHRKTAI